MLLFDSEARRVEGYSAQLPARPDAAADCLDEMHRLVHADGFRIAAVVGRAESEVTAEDRACWPAFEGASWFPALPDGAALLLGIGCVGRQQFGIVFSGASSMMGAIVDTAPADLPEGLTSVALDEKQWLIASAVPEAARAYAALKEGLKGSLEAFLEKAPAEDPHLVALTQTAVHFKEVYESLAGVLGIPAEVIAIVKSPGVAERIGAALGVGLTLYTEPEPAGRGAALWALERVS